MAGFLALLSLSGMGLAGEENDLWLLLSSFEDQEISISALLDLLSSEGYRACMDEGCVMVELSCKEVFLIPNGAERGLADLCLSRPSHLPSHSADCGKSLIRRISPGEVRRDERLSQSNDMLFIKEISALDFPSFPEGGCLEGSRRIGRILSERGYRVRYMFSPGCDGSQGHIWVAAEDHDQPGTWIAVDSLAGITTDDSYYRSSYGFDDIEHLDDVNPTWTIL